MNFRKIKFDYKWVIAIVCFMMVFITLGFCSSNKSIYVNAITNATGISRGLFSLNDSFRFITSAIVSFFFGSLIEKFGAKKLILVGYISLICSTLIYSVALNIFVFYIGGILLGLGLAFTTTGMVGCIINKWFKENKGTIMGAVMAANGLGGALAVQIITPIIYDENNPFGYQNSYRLVSLIIFVTAIFVLIFLREHPKNEEKTAFTVSKKKAKGNTWVGIDYAFAKKKGIFWASIVCIFLTGLLLQGMNGVAAAHMKDVGIDASYIATVLSLHSIALTAFKFLTGVLYDKLGLRVTYIICSVAAIVSIVSLVLLTNNQIGFVWAMVFGIISSLALPLETIMLPLFAGDLFGEKSFNKILGLYMSFNTAGYAIGSPAINFVYDKFGSYVYGFIVCGILMVVVLVAMQIVISKAHKLRKAI